MITHKLKKPLHDGPLVITTVSLREPSARELASGAKDLPADEFDRALSGIALLTGLEVRVLEQLSARDFTALANAAAAIFAEV